MAFPHPEPSKNKYGNGDKPDDGRIIGKVLERTINIANDRYGKDDVGPAKDQPLSGSTDHRCHPPIFFVE